MSRKTFILDGTEDTDDGAKLHSPYLGGPAFNAVDRVVKTYNVSRTYSENAIFGTINNSIDTIRGATRLVQLSTQRLS
jgi:hypothetical protein